MQKFGMNDAVREMKKTPGVYFITNEAANGLYIAVEVAEDGKVYQLNPDNERDGELDDEGWNTDVKVVSVAPEGGERV